MNNTNQSPAWQALAQHFEATKGVHMRDQFASDPDRFADYSVESCGILLDYSKNRIDPEVMMLLMDLARERDVEGWRNRMFKGDAINATEGRAALHTALRAKADTPVMVEDENITPKIHQVRDQMHAFSDGIRDGRLTGATGKRITDVVNIGIGGSHLGPQMAVEALAGLASPNIRIHFVSGVDRTPLETLLRRLSWETTLFIVSSKSFTTPETQTNANAVRSWFLQQARDAQDMKHHFAAVTSLPSRAVEFGIAPENIFEIWDWVGGRYSLWSAVGLPLAIAIGMDGFEAMLNGAHLMDRHFLEAPLEANMPVILALLGVWYTNFYGATSHAVIPYTQMLRQLPVFLQQLDMESNGKGVDRDGNPVTHATAPVVWGGAGTDVQHSFFQKLHQGVGIVPVDFIVYATPSASVDAENRILLANCFAQSEALMAGKGEAAVRQELESAGHPPDKINALVPHKVFPGNRPSNTLVMKWLDPKTLGSLIALYEHKVFVQGILWQLDSFDQWGVELGKVLARDIAEQLKQARPTAATNASTSGLIKTVMGSGVQLGG